MTATLSAAEARRMTLGAQGFSRRRPGTVSSRHLHRAMERMGVLQIDSVNVFARSHYLPVFARLGEYDGAQFDRAFFSSSSRYVEYLAHEAAFVPAGDWALWRFRMDDFRRKWEGDAGSWLNANGRTLAWVLDELRERGPLRPADLRDDAPRERGGWWDWDEVKMALEHLWRLGDVAVAGRRGFERSYALAEHVIPAEALAREVTRDAAIRELVLRAARAYGVAAEADIADYHRIRDRAAVRRAIEDLTDAGELAPVVVRGWERGGKQVPAWMHTAAALPRRIDGAALLTPFDPVVWFRDRALRVFDLDYRIEIYVPAEKRRYGYYSLPVLVGDRIVARVDLKADRAASALLVQSAWWEPQSRASDAVQIAGELLRAASWQGLERISVSGWGDAAEPIAQALHGGVVDVERHRHPRE
ncbi:winged helix-turn-helix domain-containing protein [Microbacterium bovistercoris]|uniref:Winged helix-turn-helix domain-containing protein n=1 Tax=Microbacterium bovistercoris TaxID=2293570 RepID=A0A371NXU0_9MICO|nr:crosslink repair DNA glycosylase YcaQ family protein [Microbacterium bovistercoris]REJ08191.1 winged helix-turn-helix domain-containing protein [Microbacterium bovistercoris]